MTSPASAYVDAALATFMPRLQVRLLSRKPPGNEEKPVFTFQGAALLVDILGFKELTSQFEKQGKAGAEELSGVLRQYFGRLTDTVLKYGGDVIGFAGDSALAIWPAETPGALVAPVAASLQAAAAIQSEIGDPQVNRGILRHRCVIAVGELNAIHLGGMDGTWQFLLAGEPLREAGAVIRQTSMATLAMTNSAWTSIAELKLGGRKLGDF